MFVKKVNATWTYSMGSSSFWGPDPVHPTIAAYQMMAEDIEADLQDKEARYTNPRKHLQLGAKKARHNPSLERAEWVNSCSAALPRKDSLPAPRSRGHGYSATCAHPGHARPYYTPRRGSAGGYRGGRPERAAGDSPLADAGEATGKPVITSHVSMFSATLNNMATPLLQ
jgi:hypothetical protein